MLKNKLRWTYYSDMLEDEYKQCISEGKNISGYRDRIDRILQMSDSHEREVLAEILMAEMGQETVHKDFEFIEPSDLEGIMKLLSPGHEVIYQVNSLSYEEKIKGAWYGRVIGCLLGIPVEGWSREKIISYLKASDQYPLQGYISSSQNPKVREAYGIEEEDPSTPYDRVKICWSNCVDSFPTDDDINYTVIAMKLVERYGKNFTSEDVAETWLLGIPGLHACTAERAAYRNLMNGILPPQSAMNNNPYREWIGAQIRGDFFGYINPGSPWAAARMAYLDASISHTKNGIYGEMFISALISLSYVDNLSMYERIHLALKQIPTSSRLYKAIKELCDDYKNGRTYEEIIDNIHKTYDEAQFFDWCLTIPNALIVIASLLFFEKSFDGAISNTVLCGFDTDCNAATVGSVMGLLHGFSAIHEKWYRELKPCLSSSVYGYASMSLDEAVQRTIRLMKL